MAGQHSIAVNSADYGNAIGIGVRDGEWRDHRFFGTTDPLASIAVKLRQLADSIDAHLAGEAKGGGS